MWYVHVLVADPTYHKDAPLTYSSDRKLQSGDVVLVPLQKKRVLGIVSSLVDKPALTAKPVVAFPTLPPLPPATMQLLSWMRSYYPAPLGMISQLFLPDALPIKPAPRRSEVVTIQRDLPALTQDQYQAVDAAQSSGVHLLHGQTGSGKTRVYLELAMNQWERGRSSIILTPEIGLTSQLATTFRDVFGERVVLWHSGLTTVTRRQTWQWVLEQKKPVIIIGARSALFSPAANVGLIVADESHESSYKQDQAPYYNGITVAAKLSSIHGATFVSGSATPLISDYYIAKAKGRPIIRMNELAAARSSEESEVQVVDLRDRSQFGKSPYLANSLIDAIKDRLDKREQALLFLNRRGTARVIFCERCGWQAVCPHCDLPLVYHGDSHTMRCHSCSYKSMTLSSCPECKSTEIVFKSVGTKAIYNEIERPFPEAKVMRFDTDNKKSERLEAHYNAIRSGKLDIIVGTQTLAKGLDLPRLSLVGVIIADTSLYFPDFSAKERTYQLLCQVVGRVGRGHRQGLAIIQTYSPESSVLSAVLSKKWNDFYNSELEERQKFLFPPFCYLLKLTCKRASHASAQKAAEDLATKLRGQNNNIRLEGPAPAFHERLQNKFIWQLIIKSKHRKYLTDIVKRLPSGWSYDIDPINLL